MNFWQQLPNPFFVLAPMDDVTDVVFRQVVCDAAAPDVLFTEFISTDGLQSPGREHTMQRLRIEPHLDRPLVAQIWGAGPEKYLKTAQDILEINAELPAGQLGFAGIDINMGCPEKGIVARGCCGGLIGQNQRAAEIIQAVKEGAPTLPISVKTRTGLKADITEEWAGFLLGQGLAALTLHARTVRDMSKVPARWDEVAKAVNLRDELAPDTIIIGNGDVRDRAHGIELAAETGTDGIMIGRGVFKDLFCFAPAAQTGHTPEQMITILRTHLDLYERFGAAKPFQVLKKFFKIYVAGWPGAAELRSILMDAASPDEVRRVLDSAGF